MFDALGRWLYRERRWTLTVAAVFALVAALWGSGVFGSLANGGFTDPHSESQRAAALVASALGRADADAVVVYHDPARTVDDPAFERAVTSRLAALPSAAMTGVTAYWPARPPALVSADRHTTYVALRFAGGSDDAKLANYRLVRDGLTIPGVQTAFGGNLGLADQVSAQSRHDLARAEALSLPILLVLLVVIFGSVVAALLPVAVGVLTILGAFTGLRLLTMITDVSVFAANVITLLGLGLAIDYGLFVISRFREELADGRDTATALRRTLRTAGRTVAVSAVTVAVSLSSLLLFPQAFLRSMAMGGVLAVLLAMLFALTVLPALLGVLGPRVNSLRVRRRSGGTGGGAAWGRIAHGVMRRPVTVAVAVLAVLVVLGLPFLRISFGWVDARVLPQGAQARQAQELLDSDFPNNAASPIEAIVSGGTPAGLAAYRDRVAAVPGVTSAVIAGSARGATRVTAQFSAPAVSPQARQVVRDIRGLAPPPGASVLVGGRSATFADLLDSLAGRLPWMALLVAITTFVLLFLSFGSVVLPIKAMLMNVLSLSATFGALVWIFQEGHLSGLLDFTSTGDIDATQPILLLAVAFGLSMDYEVFLLSRVREQYDLTGDTTGSVATGLQRTGGIITSAALLLMVVCGAFATAHVLLVKLVGIGLLVAIAVDATIVRVLLVPATMRLLGRFNWYAPGPLRRLYARYGVSEADEALSPGTVPERSAQAV
jgi:trehalose monomycolate/heme transporter